MKLYTDPLKPTERQITATLELTHAVAPGELDKRIKFSTVGGSQIFSSSDATPRFAITYGPHQRRAYLRSPQASLPEQEDFLKVIIDQGVATTQGGARTASAVEKKVRIPSLATMFKIDSIAGSIVRNKNGQPEQLVILNTSAEISTKELAKALEIRLLPKKPAEKMEKNHEQAAEAEAIPSAHFANTESEDGVPDQTTDEEEFEDVQSKEDERWQSPTGVPDDVKAAAKRIDFTIVPDEKPTNQLHAFRVQVESDGELFVHVAKGVRALGNYPLAEDHDAVVPVPELPREVQVEGEGGLLALNGERKLLVRSRGLPAIEYEVARVATTQINHLASQTEGRFAHPDFRAPWAFNHENLSRIALEHQSIALENKWKANFSTFDFAGHLHKPADGEVSAACSFSLLVLGIRSRRSRFGPCVIGASSS